ncbi:MAG: hypothetical protein AB8B78_11815 [Polaribacter sp.]
MKDHFFYGEILKMGFDKIKGFKEKEGLIYPGLELLVLDKNKDTVLFNDDLYKDEIDGFESSSFKLTPQITIANPMKSNSKYKVYTRLWDKIGEGDLKTETKISVVPFKDIKIKNNNFKYKEIYIYSDKREKVILNKKVFLNENIYFIIEGLEGFTIKDGKLALGASVSVIDSSGRVIFENSDLFKDSEDYSLAQIKERFSAYVIFNEKEKGDVKIRFRVKVWDKNNLNNSLLSSTNLLLVDDN